MQRRRRTPGSLIACPNKTEPSRFISRFPFKNDVLAERTSRANRRFSVRSQCVGSNDHKYATNESDELSAAIASNREVAGARSRLFRSRNQTHQALSRNACNGQREYPQWQQPNAKKTVGGKYCPVSICVYMPLKVAFEGVSYGDGSSEIWPHSRRCAFRSRHAAAIVTLIIPPQ